MSRCPSEIMFSKSGTKEEYTGKTKWPQYKGNPKDRPFPKVRENSQSEIHTGSNTDLHVI